MYDTSLSRWEWTCESIRGGRTASCATTDNTCTINSIATPSTPINCQFEW
jgi:hypothetical protein